MTAPWRVPVFATFPAIGGTTGAAHRPVADATSAPRSPAQRWGSVTTDNLR